MAQEMRKDNGATSVRQAIASRAAENQLASVLGTRRGDNKNSAKRMAVKPC